VIVEIVITFPPPPSRYRLEVRVIKKLPYDLAVTYSGPESLMVIVDGNRAIFLNNRQTDLEGLGKLLRKAFEVLPEDRRAVCVKASQRIPYGYFVTVIDVIKGAGASQIGMQIDYISD